MNEAIKEALEQLDASMAEMGGCSDGACVVHRRGGMHTNGGCRCPTNQLTMQRFAYRHNKFVSDVRAALATGGRNEQ